MDLNRFENKEQPRQLDSTTIQIVNKMKELKNKYGFVFPKLTEMMFYWRKYFLYCIVYILNIIHGGF